MIPSNYVSYFQAAAQASAALLGLLFVVIALRPAQIVGPHANPVAKGLAGSTFTGLVDAFFVSLLALIPGHKIAPGALILAILSLYHTLRLHLGLRGARHIAIFVASLLAYGLQLCIAVAFVLNPHNTGLVGDLTFALVLRSPWLSAAPGSCCKAGPSWPPTRATLLARPGTALVCPAGIYGTGMAL